MEASAPDDQTTTEQVIAGGSSSERVKILIVDDNPEKLLALEAVLEELGQHIVRAYSGREALRCLLNEEFAVILLDVNMPGMDGFETAAMIRRRKLTEHVPIIFVTAYSDETHMGRGYSLGAVDYILAPIMPEVLKTKVAVFVELFRKSQQVRRQADSLRRRAQQLQKLTGASIAINSALSLEKMLQQITETARDVIGANQAITLFVLAPGGDRRAPRTMAISSFSDKYADWRDRELVLDTIAGTIVARSHGVTRLTLDELHRHPDWDVVRRANIPPIVGGMLAAPLTRRDGVNMGVIYLSDKEEGAFSEDDEAVLVQLAHMATIAIENAIFAEERETNRIKDEFLAMLSHELRTPLNAILGWSQLLRMVNTPEEQTHGLEVIERNVRSQMKLIEDLLDVSRITSGKLRLSTKQVPVAPLVEAAVEAVRPNADARAVRLETEIGSRGEVVNGDPDRLQQVVWNLLSNAVKFTPKNGEVRVRVERRGEAVEVSVSDTGLGINPSFLPYVFDRFRQADSTSTRSHGGLGIGLTIVRHIVEMHGGSVRADSRGEGQGATFTVSLPVLVETRPTGTPALASPSRHAGGGAGPVDDLSGLRVLVIDDEPDARDVVRAMLRRTGADVITAGGCREGVECFLRDRPNIIVSDIAMPEEDGYMLIRRVREMTAEQGGQTPAIALTAFAREEDRMRALAAGFQTHLAKPVSPEELVTAIANLVGPLPTGNGNGRGGAVHVS